MCNFARNIRLSNPGVKLWIKVIQSLIIEEKTCPSVDSKKCMSSLIGSGKKYVYLSPNSDEICKLVNKEYERH